MKPNIHVGSFSLAMAVRKREAFIPIKGTFITPHAQRERGKVIGRGVHIIIYIYIYVTGSEKTAHLAQDFKIELLVL